MESPGYSNKVPAHVRQKMELKVSSEHTATHSGGVWIIQVWIGDLLVDQDEDVTAALSVPEAAVGAGAGEHRGADEDRSTLQWRSAVLTCCECFPVAVTIKHPISASFR